MIQLLSLNELIVNNVYFLEILRKSDHNLKFKIKIIGYRIKGYAIDGYNTLLTNYPSDHDNNFEIKIIFEILEFRNQPEVLRNYPYYPYYYCDREEEYRLIADWVNKEYRLYKPETEEIHRRLEQKNLKDVLQKYVGDEMSEIYKEYC